MTADDDRETHTEATPIASFPDPLADGTTALVAVAGAPTDDHLCLRTVAHCGRPGETALVVTTREGAEQALATYRGIGCETGGPSLAFVDTTSESQYLTVPYDDHPTVYLPETGDLERILLSLSRLSGADDRDGTRHVVVRSLTPVIDDASPRRVGRFLAQASELRAGTGIGLFGLDYTAHDGQTLTELAAAVDGVIWVTRGSDGIECDFRATRTDDPLSTGATNP